jgi:hypothetical protein
MPSLRYIYDYILLTVGEAEKLTDNSREQLKSCKWHIIAKIAIGGYGFR